MQMTGYHDNIIIFIFVLTSVFHACIGWTISYEELSSISALSYVLVDFRFFQITSEYLISCFPRSFSGETTANLKGSTFTRSSTIVYSFQITKPLQSSCKDSLALFNFSLALSSSAEVLSLGLMLHIHLTILASFRSSLITSSSITGQVSRPYSITLCTHAEYSLSFAPKGRLVLANKSTKSLNLHHPLLIFLITLASTPRLSPIVSPRQQSFSAISKRLTI